MTTPISTVDIDKRLEDILFSLRGKTYAVENEKNALKHLIREVAEEVITNIQPIQMFRNPPENSTTRTAQDLQVEAIARVIIAEQRTKLNKLMGEK